MDFGVVENVSIFHLRLRMKVRIILTIDVIEKMVNLIANHLRQFNNII